MAAETEEGEGMSKKPPQLPEIGERCKLRGRPLRGILRKVNDINKWAEVEWDIDARGPTVVHHWELEREPPR